MVEGIERVGIKGVVIARVGIFPDTSLRHFAFLAAVWKVVDLMQGIQRSYILSQSTELMRLKNSRVAVVLPRFWKNTLQAVR